MRPVQRQIYKTHHQSMGNGPGLWELESAGKALTNENRECMSILSVVAASVQAGPFPPPGRPKRYISAALVTAVGNRTVGFSREQTSSDVIARVTFVLKRPLLSSNDTAWEHF
jgi:hypothetical protein